MKKGLTGMAFAILFILTFPFLNELTQKDIVRANLSFPYYFPLISKSSAPKWIGPYGGSVVSIAVDPKQSQIIYAGTWGGGVHKSTDGGTTWFYASNGLGVLFIDSLAVDPDLTNIIYAGTHGGGVYRSTNGGLTWYPVNSGIQDRAVVYSITVNPGNHSIVYAATRGAPETPGPPWSGILYKSTDSGSSWYPVLSNVGGEDQQDWVYSVRVNPSSPDIVLAATHEHGPYIANNYGGQGDWGVSQEVPDWSGRAVEFDPRSWTQAAYYATWHGDGIYKSTNGGYHWFKSNSGMGFAKIYPNGIAYEPSNPNNLYLASFGKDVHGVLKSTNAGNSWSMIGLSNNYIYAVGTPAYSRDIVFAGTLSDGFYKSSDGGATWSHNIKGLVNSNVSGIVIKSGSTVYASTKGGGVFRSTDGGLSWVEYNTNLGDMNINGLVLDPANNNILYALTSSSGLKKIDLSSGSGWIQAAIPFLTSSSNTGFNRVDPLSRTEPMEEILGFSPINNRSISTTIASPILSMEFTPNYHQVAYLGTEGSGIYKTINGGSSWGSVGLEGASVPSIEVHPIFPNTVYAATDQAGIVKISTNGGVSWASLPAIPETPYVYSLAILSTEPRNIYAGSSNGLWKFDGSVWKVCGLAGKTVTVLRTNEVSLPIFLAGTTNGAYVSFNNSDWNVVSPESNGYAIGSIDHFIQNGENLILLGTTTRGILQAPIP